MPNWMSVKEKLPPDDLEAVCFLDYKSTKFEASHIALMYRHSGAWYFVGKNSEYRGKYLTHWLDNLDNPT